MKRTDFRHLAIAMLSLSLLSCGGGGGGGGSNGGNTVGVGTLRVAFDTAAVDFSAAAVFDQIAQTARINGTVTGEPTGIGSATVYILVEAPPNAFFTLPEVQLDGLNAGHAVVQVPTARQMGPGNFSNTFRIRVCLNSPTCSGRSEIAGSPHTVTVHYTVGDIVDGDTVMPRVVQSGAAGSVILRGHGFTPTTAVLFGATPAASVTYVSATELRANYPALAAGTHAIALNSGAIAFNASLTAVAPSNYSYAWIPHLAPSPFFTNALVYDAERRAFTYAGGANSVNHIVRYAYSNGAWIQSGFLDNQWVADLQLSHDGSRILALDQQQYATPQLFDLDPVTLAVQRTTPIAYYAWTLALSNDGNYVFANRFPGSGRMAPIMFGATDRTVVEVDQFEYDNPIVVGSGDGSRIVTYGQYGEVGIYNSSAQTWTAMPFSTLNGSWDTKHPSMNVTGTRLLTDGRVFDENLQLIGFSYGAPSAWVLNADGSRLYVYDQGDFNSGSQPVGKLRTFDLNSPATPVPNQVYPQLAEIGVPIVLPNNPNGVYLTDADMAMVITPDGQAVIICGLEGCVVQPTPQ